MELYLKADFSFGGDYKSVGDVVSRLPGVLQACTCSADEVNNIDLLACK